MKHKTKFMFDTVAFNRVVECDVFDSLYNKNLLIYATHVQRDEINNTPDPDKKSRLLRVFREIPKIVPTESAVWCRSKWNEAKWTRDDLCKNFEAELDRRKKKPNNDRDALIADTSIKNGFTLVTADIVLCDVTREFGGNCASFVEFKSCWLDTEYEHNPTSQRKASSR